MRCKAGDLAFITKTYGGCTDSNVGKIVRCIELVDFPVHGPHWLTRSMQGPMITNCGTYEMEGHCRDESLTPIRGEPGNADEIIKEKELERA